MMSMSTRGRGGVRTSSKSNRFSSTGTGFGRTTKKRSTGSRARCGATQSVATGYKTCSTNFANKVNSFKMLFKQTQGPAGKKCGRPTLTTLNSFANWINKGAVVQTVTSAQVAKWAKAARKNFSPRTATPTACKNVLCAKFGKNTIKAVARTKTGSFMVATSPVVSGRPFCFPK